MRRRVERARRLMLMTSRGSAEWGGVCRVKSMVAKAKAHIIGDGKELSSLSIPRVRSRSRPHPGNLDSIFLCCVLLVDCDGRDVAFYRLGFSTSCMLFGDGFDHAGSGSS